MRPKNSFTGSLKVQHVLRNSKLCCMRHFAVASMYTERWFWITTIFLSNLAKAIFAAFPVYTKVYSVV